MELVVMKAKQLLNTLIAFPPFNNPIKMQPPDSFAHFRYLYI